MTEKEIAKTLGLNLFSYKEKVKIINEREPHYQGFGARPSILKPTEKLWMTLLKYKTNLTYLQIANLFDVSEATCHRNIERITKILADYQEEKIVLEKIKLEKSKNILIVDATEIKKKTSNRYICKKWFLFRQKSSTFMQSSNYYKRKY